jgi:phospholipase C
MATKKVDSMLLLLLLLLHLHSGTHAASPIKTVVVLVMENRSFDHMLGWMKKINPEINGVDGSEWNALSVTDPTSKRFFFDDQSHYVDPDPGHSFQAIREQIFGSDDTSANPAPMNGFAQQAFSMDNTTKMSHSVMNGFQPDKVAVFEALVSEFAVFDRLIIKVYLFNFHLFIQIKDLF